MQNHEKIEEIKNILISHAKGEIILNLNERFDALREFLIQSSLKKQLPNYIIDNNNIDDCWKFIDSKKDTKSGKIGFIEGSFPKDGTLFKQPESYDSLLPVNDKDKPIIPTEKNNKIFIVHGHNNELKTELARFIEKLGLEAIILHEQESSGKTIIEKIEKHSDVGYAIILYTPCDLGKLNNKSSKSKPRARQNVVFEHGFFIGKLGRGKVAALVKGKVETPNDISGIVYISIDNNEWKTDIAKELKGAGYILDYSKLL